MNHPSIPTAEQCNVRAEVESFNGRRAYACWYPQIGGYTSHAVVIPGDKDLDGDPGCFEAFVWHDGEFPFSKGTPRRLHHCSPDQFVSFGTWVGRLKS